MIIWLNGPFGIGKTSTAHALLRRLPAALLYDPEPFGAALRKTVATFEAAADFQELRAWPSLVVETARVLSDTYGRPLVLPLTVWRRSTVEVLLSGLRAIDPDVRPFRLVASEAVLRARIMGRPVAEGSHAWCLTHLDAGLQMMGDAAFGEAIRTEGQTPDQVANTILERVSEPSCANDQRLGGSVSGPAARPPHGLG